MSMMASDAVLFEKFGENRCYSYRSLIDSRVLVGVTMYEYEAPGREEENNVRPTRSQTVMMLS
jgi:hypothetical protein